MRLRRRSLTTSWIITGLAATLCSTGLSSALSPALSPAMASPVVAEPASAPLGAAAATAPDPLQKLLDQLAGQGGAVGVVAEQVTPAGASAGSAGESQLRPDRPAQRNAHFRAASITKQLVTVAALQRVASGQWTLQTTIGDALPGVWPAEDDVTLRQLLSHTSGIPDFLNAIIKGRTWTDLVDSVDRYRTPRSLVAAAKTLPPLGPGDRIYSNTNFVLVGMMLSRATGLPLGKVLTRDVLRPARMWQSHYDTTPGLAGPRLKEYGVVNGSARSLAAFNPTTFAAAGALVTTPRDLNRFQLALATGRLLPARLVTAMKTPVSKVDGLDYGLGTMLLPDPCDPDAFVGGHNGGSFATTSWSLSSTDGSRRAATSWTGRNYDGKVTTLDVRYLFTALARGCPQPVDERTAARTFRIWERALVPDTTALRTLSDS